MALISGKKIEKEDLKIIGHGLGQRIRRLREKMGYSIESLEKEAEIGPVLTQIEAGQKMISIREAESLAKVLGVSTPFIIAGD